MSLPEISPATKRTWQRKRHDRSAGGVAYRRISTEQRTGRDGSEDDSQHNRRGEPGSIEIALIATRGGRRWQLPKGALEGNEGSRQAAVREVEEEVGLQTEVEQFLRTIDYWYWDTYRKEVPELVHKTVDFYLLRVVGGTLNDQSYEVDAVGWFSFERAQEVMTFSGELEVVRLAMERLGVRLDTSA